MSVRTSCRFGMALLLAALISGCSLLGSEGAGAGSSGAYSPSGECSWNRSRCLYEGAYEPGERDYAEQEAKALNRAALEKLRRNAGR